MAIAILVIIYLTFVSMGLPDSVLGSSFPAISQNLGISADQGGYISMVVSLGTIFSALISSWLLKKIKTPILVAISVLCTAIALVLFSFVSSAYAWAFYPIAIILGVGGGGIDAALNNYVALHYKAIHMNWLHCSWGIGVTISPLIIGSFIDSSNNSSGWQKGVLILSFIQLALFVIILLLLPLWNKVTVKEKKVEEKEVDGQRKTIKEFGVLKNPVFYLAMAGFFSYCAIETTTGLWIASYFTYGKGLDTDQAAMLTSVFYLGITIGRFISGFLSLRLIEKQMIRIGEGIILLGSILCLLPFNVYLPIVGFSLVGLGCAPIYPAIIRSTPYRFSRSFSQNAMGLEMAFAYAGSLSIPPLFGLVAKSIANFTILPYVVLALLALMVFCHEYANMLLKKRDQRLTEAEKAQYRA